MIPLYVKIAKSYLKTIIRKQSLSIMIRICFMSILLGTLSLSLSIFIMTGFEEATTTKLRNINPHIVIQPIGNYLHYEKMKPILESEFKEIKAFAPTTNQYGILQTTSDIDLSTVFMINAIDPLRENNVTNIEKYIVAKEAGKDTLAELLANNGVLIGKKLSVTQGIFPGDKATLIFAKQHKKKVDFDTVDVKITGIFATGIDELDSNVITSSIEFIKKMYPTLGITQIGIQPNPHVNEQQLITDLKNRFGVEVYSWQELYPSLVSVLKLEKYVAFAVLTLLVIIASMNLISLLFMLITQKRRDIILLYVIGMKSSHIQYIFIIISLIITILATGLGLLIALGIGTYLNYYKIILPDAYYISYLPITINVFSIYTIFTVSIIITLLASWIPTKNLKKLNITEMLRLE